MNTGDIFLPDPMEIPEQHIAPLITRLASIQSILAMRLMALPANPGQPESGPEEQDEFLTAQDAANFLNVTESWLYRRAHRLPFAVRLSSRALRFSKAGLLKWRATKVG